MTQAATGSCYVFAVVDADTPEDLLPDVGDAAFHTVRVIRAGGVGAVVGTLDAARPLGRAADLRAHDRVVTALVSASVPVLPVRFGAVVADERAVTEDFLTGHAEQFRSVLDELRGRAQYTVTISYEQDAVLRELVETRPEIAALRRAGDDRASQLRLGERVVAALAQLREEEAPAVLDRLAAASDQLRVRDPESPDQLVRAALLVRTADEQRLVDMLEELGRSQAGRLRVRLVGPVAPYDFVPED